MSISWAEPQSTTHDLVAIPDFTCKAGDYDGAIADATKVIELLPTLMGAAKDDEYANAYALRGLAQLRLGKDEEAQRDIASAIMLNSRLKSWLEAESAKIKQARRPKQ